MRYHEFKAMSTEILLAAEGSAVDIDNAFDQTQAYIEACERRFTRFSEDSELSALNRSTGSWFEASAEMYELITLAARLHERTLRLFDPSILNALERAGYDQTIAEVKARGPEPNVSMGGMPGKGSVRSAGPMAEVLAGQASSTRFTGIRLDPALRRILLPVGMRIDLGGIAKGWIAERAARRLATWVRAGAVDAGGDAFFFGLPAGETCWRVTLEDPWEAGQGLAVLKVGPGAIATSAVTRRRWKQNNQTQHHLIDPRTQLPAETDWLSVTVIGPHTAEAEVFAKCLLIAGPEVAERLAANGPGIEFIAIDKNKKLWGSKFSRELLDV